MQDLDSLLNKPRSRPEVVDVVARFLQERGERDQLQVVELAPQFASLLSRSGKIVRILRHPAEIEELHELIDRCLDQNPRKGSDVIVVGGPARSDEVILEALPRAPRHPFVVYHLPEDAAGAGFPKKKSDRKVLELLADIRVLSSTEIESLLRNAQKQHQAHLGEAKERAEFFGRMGARKPRVTIGLLIAIALVFAHQNLAGFDLETTYNIGALHGDSVRAGEWWRMISTGFLHGGFMHVAMNGFVLYLLGGQLERVIGGYRFVLLYLAALIGGSFLSMQFAEANSISVGASGAIWGLLGAQASLAFGRPPVVPQSVAESMKPLAKQNLFLNFLISFVPGIDWAAHFGGGLAGGLLLASGLLHRGSDDDGRAGSGVRLLSVLAILLMAGCVVRPLLS